MRQDYTLVQHPLFSGACLEGFSNMRTITAGYVADLLTPQFGIDGIRYAMTLTIEIIKLHRTRPMGSESAVNPT